MKITNQQIQNWLKIYNPKTVNVNKKGSDESVEKSSAIDDLALSGESRIKQQAMQAAKQFPDIREDVVAELKEKIATGTYTANDGEVAEKMISQSIFDETV